MLEITVPAQEILNEDTLEFISIKETKLRLEHSLVSISKWEAKFHKPFLTNEPKTIEETREYVKFMTITQNVDDNVYLLLTQDNINEINKYIENPMTATWFADNLTSSSKPKRMTGEVVTSELIYFWMVSYRIPVEFQKWHLNRLMTLIKICDRKNQPDKKMSKSEILRRNKELNAARLKKYNTKG
jgi:hypothetical protein